MLISPSVGPALYTSKSMESIREFISQSLLIGAVSAILFMALGIFITCYILQPGTEKLVDWILGPEHRAAKREREAQAEANLIAYKKAEAVRREAEKVKKAEEMAEAAEFNRRIRENLRRGLPLPSYRPFRDKKEE